MSNWYEGLRVVGTSYRREQVETILGSEQRRDITVTLVPEPSNPHDPHAVAVEHEGTLIGYIARDKTHVVREWLGEDTSARADVPATVYRLSKSQGNAPGVGLGGVPPASNSQREYITRLVSDAQDGQITAEQAARIDTLDLVEADRLVERLLQRQRAQTA